MLATVFEGLLEDQFDRIRKVLTVKAAEYADTDRLANFKVAAALRDTTPEQALAGMMLKHTVSIYDMIDDRIEYPMDKWDEKITDHINYLILLRALVSEA